MKTLRSSVNAEYFNSETVARGYFDALVNRTAILVQAAKDAWYVVTFPSPTPGSSGESIKGIKLAWNYRKEGE